jgi:hypothetical protein
MHFPDDDDPTADERSELARQDSADRRSLARRLARPHPQDPDYEPGEDEE